MLAAVFTLGGIQSTKGMTLWSLAFISSHSEIQAQALVELDKVIGQDYWLSAEDEQCLLYIHAAIKEMVRIHLPFWMATPHLSTEEFVYNEMYILKNLVVIFQLL
ncbi:cytochrome P450 [Russula earlei]|uniref:Cytochrome P450 n=1 Tax=Russula earlei TaxID=71964 RepID=A0ACC0U781_9AGAM|nr:cytochrome P450 [Russula earlei]